MNKTEQLPKQIPVLPVRNEVVFPSTYVEFNVGRMRTLNAIAVAQAQAEAYILVVTQKNLGNNNQDPQAEDLYTVGTICKIQEVSKQKDQYRIQLVGVARYRIDSLQLINPGESEYLQAIGEEYMDRYENPDLNRGELLAELQKVIREYANTVKSNDLIKVLMDTFDRVDFNEITLSHIASASFVPTIQDRQVLLEEIVVEKRIAKLIEIMTKEVSHNKARQDLTDKTRKNIEKSQKEYYLREQMKAIKKELGDDDASPVKDDLQQKLKQTKMPADVKKVAEEELKRLENLHPSSSEYNVVRNYLEWLMAMPWFKASKDQLDIKSAKVVLDQDHYGLEKVKKRILEYLAVAKMKNSLKGSIICLVGPPGVGKTSLGRSIARAVNRKFVRVSLGGVRDEAEIRGHRRTYVGAMPGKLIQNLKRVGHNNPVFLLDEIDKMVSGSNQGDPASAMLEVLDPEQNSTFQDHYLDVHFDLSNVLFIATANVLEDIPGPLRDRMEIIYLGGYTSNEKKHIAMNHLIPKQLQEHALSEDKIKFTPEAVNKLTHEYTREAGVRDLQRKIAGICRAVAQELLENNLTEMTVTPEKVRQYLGPEPFDYEDSLKENEVGVVTGLAWTSVGGDILFIESDKMEGSGRLTLTGSLGNVMKESAQIALTYLRSHREKLKITDNFDKVDVHIHVPSGAVPKDGPSAGVSLTTSLVSLFTNQEVNKNFAMTGEISLRGKVLPVGGIKEKVIAAHRSGIKEIILPKANESSLDEIPAEVKKELKFHLVEEITQVLDLALIKK